MDITIIPSLAALALALIPAFLVLENLRHYKALCARPRNAGRPKVSLLIPARNEEATIGDSLEAALRNQDVDLELIVLDDHSDDATASIVLGFADRDPRVKLERAPALPEGWSGKQFACRTLGDLAKHPWLVFIDSDVQLAPDSLGKMTHFMETTGTALGSGVPRQITVGFLEQLLISLIHFILLGFLPLKRMRKSNEPAMSAGCGQLFIARKEAYEQVGGHGSIRASLHDGIKLPRAFRASGFKTDLFDATDLATCRMYRSASDVWFGLSKNAGEALASPGLIVPASILLLGGQVLPFVLLIFAKPLQLSNVSILLSLIAAFLVYLPRFACGRRFQQSPLGVVLHPLGVLLFVSLQWYALIRNSLGRPAVWKGRHYPAGAKTVS